MLKRYHSDSLADDEVELDPVPVKRRSVDLPLQGQWRSAVVQHHQMSLAPPTAPAPSVAAAAPTALLTAEDWACASELNDLFASNAHNFPSIVVRSRSTFTRAERTAVAERITASSSSLCSPSSTSTQRATQHLALAAHVLTVAFAPYYPTAALSLYEIEAPGWLSGWTKKWCRGSPPAAPTTPRSSPASSTSSLHSLSTSFGDDGSDSFARRQAGNEPAVVVKLMALHGYAPGQPSCGQGAGLGEACLPATSQRRPAKTVFLPMW